MARKTVAATAEPQETKYTKAAFLDSFMFQGKRDLLNALLAEDKKYTIAEVKIIINNYLNKEV
jgi:hypothetical protein